MSLLAVTCTVLTISVQYMLLLVVTHIVQLCDLLCVLYVHLNVTPTGAL